MSVVLNTDVTADLAIDAATPDELKAVRPAVLEKE